MTDHTIEIDVGAYDVKLDLNLPPDVSISATAVTVLDVLAGPANVRMEVVGSGPPGKNGSRWFSGDDPPEEVMGAEVNDHYFDDDGNVYECFQQDPQIWHLVANLQGPIGPEGPQGDPGGPVGPMVHKVT